MNWDDLRYFLAVAREGQMLGAATRLGVSQSRLSRHITALESALNTRLLERTTRGSTLTEDGAALFETVERIEAEVLAGTSRLRGEDDVAGTVRIGAPDGFGSAFLAPRLGRFRDTYPDLRVQLVPVPRSFSLSEREADIAIMVGRPEKGRLRIKKLVDYSLGLYASKDYLARAGTPDTIEALKSHTLIGYVDDLIYSPELNYAQEIARDWRADIAVSTAVGQFEAVRAGAGIGICHDFMASGISGLVRLFPNVSVTRSYWIVWHENLRVARRVQAVVQLLDELVRDERDHFAPF
ncbi:LysR family transcriptional regulator [Salipiger sp. IMCC34102]|uniref:LysR family transcriptional regulator n=1 Tax=Salipiger sp. IMCC34102 TaxID=2510647 RepID=UPI00101DA577|nr:LysR family transcriptional regulator [Salipiger sp. IMCC34102]RYH02119.1 LysR family transcriptional regulator [Salipiger sp. IMCC34102]